MRGIATIIPGFKWIFAVGILLITGCQRELAPPAPEPAVEYLIRAGQHYADQNEPRPFESLSLDFSVRFDSSAKYTTVIPENQLDINKLYGFSDNNRPHHEFSARIGWRWSNNSLSLHAYVYNDGVRTSREITTILIDREYQCSIRISKDQYLFRVNEQSTAMPRTAVSPRGAGYKLYPYFGGDETAPHDIRIFIRESN